METLNEGLPVGMSVRDGFGFSNHCGTQATVDGPVLWTVEERRE